VLRERYKDHVEGKKCQVLLFVHHACARSQVMPDGRRVQCKFGLASNLAMVLKGENAKC
jgi:hypothetical protein